MFPDKSKSLVQIKVRTRVFIKREFDEYLIRLKQCTEEAEIWNINIEQLRLTIMEAYEKGIPQFHHMQPLNVLEINDDGTLSSDPKSLTAYPNG